MILKTAKPQLENIPVVLTQLPQWVTWKNTNGTKMPTQLDGTPAKSNDPDTWTTFDRVADEPRIAFMFAGDDPYCGIDLDVWVTRQHRSAAVFGVHAESP